MFGKVMRVPDANLDEYWNLLLGETPPPGEPPNLSKRRLAATLVDRFHGEGQGMEAEAAFNRVFVDHEAPEQIESHVLEGSEVHLPAVLADAFGVSRSEARRVLQQGGVKLDGEVLPAEPLDYAGVDLDGRVIQLGKRRFRKLETRS
jgi:tyrosyl-tRNA synthetase